MNSVGVNLTFIGQVQLGQPLPAPDRGKRVNFRQTCPIIIIQTAFVYIFPTISVTDSHYGRYCQDEICITVSSFVDPELFIPDLAMNLNLVPNHVI